MAADPRFAPGQLDARGRVICGAKNRQGQPCGKNPEQHFTRCPLHGGAAPWAREAAETRRQEAEARKILMNLGEPVEGAVNPVDVLLRLIAYKWAEVLWLRAKVQALEPGDLVYGVDTVAEGEERGEPTNLTTYKVGQNIWWKLLREAEKEARDLAVAAARAGIEERTLRLNEQTAGQFLDALNRILGALNLTDEQASMVPTIVPQVLRALSDGQKT